MEILSDDELVGSGPDDLAIQGVGAEALVRLDQSAVQRLGARIAEGAGERTVDRVYLSLEGIRGELDASVLNVFLRLPDATTADPRQGFHAGSIGLYGLRRASVPLAGTQGRGLGCVLDVTAFFAALDRASVATLDTLVVSIQPHRELPINSSIAVAKIRIFRESHACRPGDL